jgi:hypothetical protein
MGATNSGARTAKIKAEIRLKALWDHYNNHKILYLTDFKRITGGQYQAVMDTFATYGLQSPPVYDSRQEKYKRKAKLLTDEAARLNQNYLTISQAARVLNTKASRVIGIEGRLLRAGCSLPEIVTGESKVTMKFQENRDFTEFSGKLNGTCNPLYYPPGLQVLKYWPGPGADEVTYLLR